MRRYLRPSAVNGPVAAWGLYKGDDDQTHSDDLRCRDGWRGGKFARARARVPGSARFGLFDGAAALSVRRLPRLSPRSYRVGCRLAGRWRGAAKRAVGDRAAGP